MERITGFLARYLGLEELRRDEDRAVIQAGLLIAFLAMFLRVLFWAYTNRYWEDALITCLHSENCVQGFGLTHYRPGEPPLHGFTSPLSVLVPLLGDLMHVGFGVDFLKLVSIPAAALTVLYLLAIGLHREVRLPAPLLMLVTGYAAIEHQQILFGMAGMETQLASLVLIMSLYYTVAWKPVPLGLSLGLCMLARPDYAFWTMVIGVYALFRDPRRFPKIVALACALYLPWILFTFWYYGSPIPNTIVAKGLGYVNWWDKVDAINFFTIKRRIWLVLAEQLIVLLGPTFCGHGAGIHIFFTHGPESPVGNLMFFFAVIGALAILFRRQWVLWPLLAGVVVYSLYYIFLVPVIFGWYKNPYILTMLLLSARGLQAAVAPLSSTRAHNRILGVFTAAYLALFAVVMPVCFLTERQIQKHIENDLRRAAGLYLQEHMKPGEAVGCEPLGYMSYYSRGNVYDWPGLASRTVVAWSKAHPGQRNLEQMLKGLQPEYLFLRDLELLYWFKDPDWFKQHYHVVKVFKISPKAEMSIRWVNRNIDTCFRILKKNHPDDPQPYDDALWPLKPVYIRPRW